MTREHWERNHKPLLIEARNLEQIRALAPRDTDVRGKAIRLLLAQSKRKTAYAGANVGITRSKDYPLAYGRNIAELRYYIRYLENRRFIEWSQTMTEPSLATMLPEGWGAIEAYKSPNSESEKVFVAMWFHDQMTSVFEEGIGPRDEDDCGYRAMRIDMKDFVGDITDKIIAEIRGSRFVVADFTGQRQGVYYESGYARGIGLPVIWTCRKDDMEKLHFDTHSKTTLTGRRPRSSYTTRQ